MRIKQSNFQLFLLAFLFTFLFLQLSNAHAARTFYVGSDVIRLGNFPDDFHYIYGDKYNVVYLSFLDAKVEKYDNSTFVTAWTLYALTKGGFDQRLFDYANAVDVKYKLVCSQYDKENKRYKLLKIVYLNSNFDVVRASRVKNLHWEEVLPDTYGEDEFNAIFEFANNKL